MLYRPRDYWKYAIKISGKVKSLQINSQCIGQERNKDCNLGLDRYRSLEPGEITIRMFIIVKYTLDHFVYILYATNYISPHY